MARRAILTAAQRAALLALPTERRDLAGDWTLSEPELAFLGRRRRDRNRLGVALQLCALRYPGRLLRPAEVVPATAVAFVAEQLGVGAGALGSYAVRERTKYEHPSILQQAFGFRPFEGIARRRRGGRRPRARHPPARRVAPPAHHRPGGHDARASVRRRDDPRRARDRRTPPRRPDARAGTGGGVPARASAGRAPGLARLAAPPGGTASAASCKGIVA